MTGTTKKTDCHSKQQMKSRQSISPQKKSDMLSQSGRSMVEVLGVLAIVGLISSGGVVGYLRTMNKHRANELKNAVSVRAIACATEISRRREPSLAEFGPYGNYTITAHKSLENTHQFQLVITPAPPSGVCEYFKIMMENTVRFFGGNCDGTDENITLTYNNDLTKTAYATDYGEAEECTAGDKRWCAPEGKCKELNQGCECLGDAPQCYSCDTETGYYEVDPNLENTACKLDPSSSTNDGACRSGSCVDPCAGLELNPCQV